MESNRPTRICWDSNCFVAFISAEVDRFETCSRILSAAEAGEIELYTSYMSLVETVKVPEQNDEDAEITIQGFFERQFIRKIELDWFVSMEARRLERLTNLDGRDAVHLASAVVVGCEFLQTYDRDLLGLDCLTLEIPIKIQEPRWGGGTQPKLPLES